MRLLSILNHPSKLSIGSFLYFVSGIKVYNSLEIFCYLLEKKGDRYWRIELIIKVERRTSFVTIVVVY